MKQPPAWYARVGVTLAATLLITVPVVHYVLPALVPWVDGRDWSMGGLLPRDLEYGLRVGIDMVALSVPPLVVCTGCYHFLSFRRFKRGATYCGTCHGLLRNLTEPICPNCGRRI